MRSRNLILISAFALAALLLPSLAAADGITWTLQNVSLNDGGMVTGTFNYNATTNSYSALNVSTTLGTFLPGFTYNSLSNAFFSGSTLLGLGPNPINTSNFTGENFLELFFTNPLTNAGGTDSVYAVELLCTNSNCSSSSMRFALSGTVTTKPVATPEPATLLLLAAGLLTLLTFRRHS